MQIKNTNHALSHMISKIISKTGPLEYWKLSLYTNHRNVVHFNYTSYDLRPPGGNYVIICNFVFDYERQHRITFLVIRRLDLYGVICHFYISLNMILNWMYWNIQSIYMQDSDRRPVSARRPVLKFMSDFYVTDMCTSDLCPLSNSQILWAYTSQSRYSGCSGWCGNGSTP